MENESFSMDDDISENTDIVSQCYSLLEVTEVQFFPEINTDLTLVEQALSKNKKYFKSLKTNILDRRDSLVAQVNKIVEQRLHEAGRIKKENKRKFQKWKKETEQRSREISKEVQDLKVKLNNTETKITEEDLFALPELPPLPELRIGSLEAEKNQTLEGIFGNILLREENVEKARSGAAKMTRSDKEGKNCSESKMEGSSDMDDGQAKTKLPEVVYVQESAIENKICAEPEPEVSSPRPISPVVHVQGATKDMLPRLDGILFDSSAKTKIHTLYAINGVAYVWCYKDSAATILKRNSTPIQTFGIFGVKNVVDLTFSVPDLTMWLCSEDCFIYMITESGRCELKFKAIGDPVCVAVKDDQVFVGTTEGVHVYSLQGKVSKTFLEKECKKIRRLTLCEKSGKLAVICELKIFVLDSNLETLYCFPDGHDQYVLRKFSAATFDRQGNVIAADVANKTLILISSEGKLKKTLIRKDDEDTPCCISAGDKGYLWAGYQSSVAPETAVIEIFEYE